MAEDKDLARQAANLDLQRSVEKLKATGLSVDMAGYDEGGLSAIAPGAPGEGVLVQFAIGSRGVLLKSRARDAARAFVEIRQRYPEAQIYPHFLGYDDDPREIWQFPEVCRYVRWWACRAGIGDWRRAIAVPWVDPECTIALLAACGAFGDDHPFTIEAPPAVVPS